MTLWLKSMRKESGMVVVMRDEIWNGTETETEPGMDTHRWPRPRPRLQQQEHAGLSRINVEPQVLDRHPFVSPDLISPHLDITMASIASSSRTLLSSSTTTASLRYTLQHTPSADFSTSSQWSTKLKTHKGAAKRWKPVSNGSVSWRIKHLPCPC